MPKLLSMSESPAPPTTGYANISLALLILARICSKSSTSELRFVGSLDMFSVSNECKMDNCLPWSM